MLRDWTAPAAGAAAILAALVDHWAFHDGFGLAWDQALFLAGITWLAGVAVPSPLSGSKP